MQEGMRLSDPLDQLNTILLDLHNIEVKIKDEDAALILLVSLPPSYENFMQSFIVRKDIVSLEELDNLFIAESCVIRRLVQVVLVPRLLG